MTMFSRRLRIAALSPLTLFPILLGASACAPDEPDSGQVAREIGGTRSTDANAESGFSVSNLVSEQYLAVTLKFTSSGVQPVSANLVRGSAKANSAEADLWVRSYDDTGSIPIAEYRISDPRIQKKEDGSWTRVDQAEKVILVPLSSRITNVQIEPAEGRDDIVSQGGGFDPIDLAKVACDAVEDSPDSGLFPNCAAIIALD